MVDLNTLPETQRRREMVIKKSRIVVVLVLSCLLFGSAGAFAASGIEKISAFLNNNIRFTADGSSWVPKDSDGAKLAPIVYKGTTYLPARAVAEVLGAEIAYNNTTQVISIKSGSENSNDGIPYKDSNEDAANTNSNSPPASESTTDIPSNGTFYASFPSNFDKDQVAAQLKAQSIYIMKVYASALVSGDVSKFNAFVDRYVTDKNEDNYLLGRQYSKDKFKTTIDGDRSANDADNRTKYSAAIINSPDSLFKLNNSYKGDYGADFSYSIYPEGWTASSSMYVYFSYEKLDNGTYVLESLYVS
jgi:hypothetical protein